MAVAAFFPNGKAPHWQMRSLLAAPLVTALATDGSFTRQEAEAVLAHTRPAQPFQKNTLLALQVLNRYAASRGIRVEDAITVIENWTSGIAI